MRVSGQSFFLGNTGYFQAGDPASLLHTWSLAVEEQFYSLTMIVVLRFVPRQLNLVLAGGLIASLATSQ